MMVIERSTVTSPILEILAHGPCILEELVGRCPDLAWDQFFLEVARLRRADKIILYSRGANYTVQLAPPARDQAFCLGGADWHRRTEQQ